MPGLVVPDTELAWLVSLLKKLFWWHLLQSLTSAVWQDQKSFSCPCFKHWMCFLESFQAHQPKECLFLFLLKQEPRMQSIIIFVHCLPWICKVWYSFHDFLYSTHFSLLSQIIASGSQCLPDFGHSGSSIMLHISSISSKRFALEDVVQTQHWYIPLFFNIPSIVPGKLWQYHLRVYIVLSDVQIFKRNLGPS